MPITATEPQTTQAKQQRKITSHDLYKLRFLRDPQVSPDGRRVAFVLSTVDRADNRYRSTIWQLPLAGGVAQQVTGGPKNDGRPRWSPDGRWLAFLSDRGEAGPQQESAGGGKPQLWLLPADGLGEARQLTFMRLGVAEFVWSPDSQCICFVAAVDEPGVLAEAKRDRDMGAGKLARTGAPDAAELAAQGAEKSNAGAGMTDEEGGSEEFGSPLRSPEPAHESAVNEEKNDANRPRVISRFSYKEDGGGYVGPERVDLFVIDVPAVSDLYGFASTLAEHDLATMPRKKEEKKDEELVKERDPRDTARQLTSGDYNEFSPRWSPDGKWLAFCSNRLPDRDLTPALDIFLIPSQLAAGGAFAEPRQLTPGIGPSGEPAWSPDGKQIAYVGHAHQGEMGGGFDNKLWLLDVEAGAASVRCLSEGFKRSLGHQVGSDMREGVGDESPIWSPDGQSIYFAASDRGANYLFRLDLVKTAPTAGAAGDSYSHPEAGLPITRLSSGTPSLLTYSFGPGQQQLVYAGSDPLTPNDLYLLNADGSGQRRLTEVNTPLFAEVQLSEPEEIVIQRDGVTVQGWLLKPADFEASKQYPFILEIHGGPHSAYGAEYTHEFQLLAARGYIVLYSNPRGSQSYGEDFANAIRGDWGGVDYADLMALVDAVVAQGYVDTARMGVTGGSYGGYMTNWIIGHTDRFKAAVTQRCISNLLSFWGTSDAGIFFGMYELPGHPWDDPATLKWYLDHSPISYLKQMKTPTLIIHSEQDYRCMIEQAEQLFAGLKLRGVETQMVRFPNESHGLNRGGQPRHRIENLERIAGWFDTHL